MTEIEEVQVKHIKICLLGSQKVGKTYLAHKLVDMEYDDYQPAIECQKFIKELAEKKQILIYYDFPPINNSLVDELTHDHIFDMLVCLFKDSASFGQLFQFFESISKKTEQNNQKFNDYWASIKNIILVYSDFEDRPQVQLQELFNILSEQIRNFNRTASIKQFVLKPQLTNHQYLRYLIEKNRFEEHFSDELISSEREIIKSKEQIVYAMITEVVSSQNLDRLHAQTNNQGVKLNNQQNEDEDQMPELAQVKLTSTKEKLLDSQESIEEADNIQTLGKLEQISQEKKEIKNEIQKRQIINVEAEQTTQASNHTFFDKFQSNPEKEPKIQVNISEKHENIKDAIVSSTCQKQIAQQNINFEPNVKKQAISNQEKSKQEHYRAVFDRLMEKINNEQIEASKKTSYKDLFQEFRRTSKEESKITKQLKDYWQYKIQKLEQEEQDDDEEEVKKENDEDEDDAEYIEPQQQKKHPHSTQNHIHEKKRGDPLKPQSTYDGINKPRRQKSAADSNSCFCAVM